MFVINKNILVGLLDHNFILCKTSDDIRVYIYVTLACSFFKKTAKFRI